MNNHPSRSIVTSASNKFFPSLLNFIGSIKKNYPDHPHIYVYNLGLLPSYIREIKTIPGVTVLVMPHFTSFWRKCYTWKTYIFKNALTDTTFYLDAGNEVLQPLDSAFEQIERQGYLAVEQIASSGNIIPKEYISLFGINSSMLDKHPIAAGIFGFSRANPQVWTVIEQLHDASLAGLCLGYSKEEIWKNKWPNTNYFIRDCPQFRHDTTLLTILMYKLIPDIKVESIDRFGELKKPHDPKQLIWNLRMNYNSLNHINASHRFSSSTLAVYTNKILLFLFFKAKRFNKLIKGIK